MTPRARAILDALKLTPHPEGGFFRETFRAATEVETERGARAASTAIYFLLPSGEISAFHQVASDEAWHFYDGDPLELHTLDPHGKHRVIMLGVDLDEGERPQHVVPAHHLQAARSNGAAGYTLVGCTVSPGFDFADFVMPTRAALLEVYPQHRALVEAFTRAT